MLSSTKWQWLKKLQSSNTFDVICVLGRRWWGNDFWLAMACEWGNTNVTILFYFGG